MKLVFALCLLVCATSANVRKRQTGAYLVSGPQRPHLQQRYPPPQAFRPPDDLDQIDRNTVAPTVPPALHITRQPNVAYRTQEPARVRPNDFQTAKRPPPPGKEVLKEEELEEEEKEEPDRLTVLLPQSKFTCQGKRTGYYADEGLNCEVFHYCQDNARHSWICPEGFLFHQVHLICMPPNHDNICTQSSQYHFINDYLYKPINADEAVQKPNVTLRYSERYYPNSFYSEDDVSRTVEEHPAQQHLVVPERTHRPTGGRQPNQVFHSPEEVNIPLQQRRPVTPQPSRSFHTTTHEHFEYL